MNLAGLTGLQINSLLDWIEDERSIKLFFPLIERERIRLCENLVNETNERACDKIRGRIAFIDSLFRLHDDILSVKKTFSEENPLEQEEVT